ncbi:MAG: ATP-binding cassette domain-containing protein [Liquorilactobacillus nagelii]|uniref:ABC transporter ATP-binding protein n=3 Tax=Liquorilactobacillus nagelii TaxID=82688 RepID=A0A3Q8CG09_9LACO|nr:ABC transporter ATP-binding protein/permease [Liquorilactobacillus nagelii]AUJ31689.1 ABC transporter ATP-binding protein [Liquorilactobacillus nagelii]KRL40435.1 ABC transporter related protein [Liquorilactobacillus nagelii DSM 13675]MCC7615944.1 ABC transporter ATP-binding protein [Liquorilactobacillus nagelii]MCP9314251.1 ATP-binding cassette domain-containing protein [Liquorilactobacillus nagelii]QYH54383.1 ATP-binding cassette domain-containing protein [Liquorilactobacillus nagelii DSM
MAFLELIDIHKSYFLGKEELPVLKGISLGFEKGEFVSILGESGGGKSTLMNIIGGLDREFSGDLLIDGQKLDHTQEKQVDDYRRARIGYIYQSYNLISHLTVLENVLISLEMTSLNRQQRIQRAKELLTQVGLADQLKKHPNQLSGGQKQRVAIARALASDPQIILADEPTGALDSQNTQEVLELLKQIAADGRLVIAVTHSQEVASHGTRIVHLEDGVIDSDRRLKAAYSVPQKQPKFTSRALTAMASYQNAFKHLLYHFQQNSLIVLGTAIGIFAVLLFSGLGNGVNSYIQDQINSLANPQVITIAGNPNGKYLSEQKAQTSMQQAGSDPTQYAISQKQINKLKKIKHVVKVQSGYQLSSYTLSAANKKATGSTLQTYTAAYTNNVLKNGSWPQQGELVLDRSLGEQLFGNLSAKKMIGKTVKVNYNWLTSNGQPVQASGSFKISGIIDGKKAGTMMLANYQSIKASLQKANAMTSPNFLSVKVGQLDQVEAAAKKMRHLKTAGKYDFAVITIGSLLKTVNRYVSLASTVLAAIAGISLLVSALMIIVTMYMSVAERTKEIGILRALGERRKDIRRLFTSESLLLGFFAAILGLVIAWSVGALLNHALYGLIKYNIVQMNLSNVIFAFAAAMIIAFIAALLPARKASRLNPIDALSAE